MNKHYVWRELSEDGLLRKPPKEEEISSEFETVTEAELCLQECVELGLCSFNKNLVLIKINSVTVDFSGGV